MWLNTAGVPVISSFAKAKARFEMTPPIRGHKDKVRPLGYRRHHRMASISMPDVDTVVLEYYGEPFVTWKSDDSFTVTNNAYQSPWTAAHLVFFLPERWETKWNGCRMTVGNKGKYYLMPQGSVFNFVKAGDDFELVNKPVAHAIRKRRGSDRLILKKCESFFDWLTVVSAVNPRITNEDATYAKDILRERVGVKPIAWYQKKVQESHADASMSNEDRTRLYHDYRMCDVLPVSLHHTWMGNRRFHTPSAEILMQWIEGDDAEDWVLAMNVIADRTGFRRYVDSTINFELTHERATTFVKDIARHVHRESVFFREQLEDGEVPTRNNDVYFRTHSFLL